MLLNATLDEVFRTTQETMNAPVGLYTVLGVLAAGAAVGLLLLCLQRWRARQAVPKAPNHPGRLVKEVARALPLRSQELRLLSQLAEAQGVSSPLVLLLCPSLLARAMADLSPARRQVVADLARRLQEGARPVVELDDHSLV